MSSHAFFSASVLLFAYAAMGLSAKLQSSSLYSFLVCPTDTATTEEVKTIFLTLFLIAKDTTLSVPSTAGLIKTFSSFG